MTDEKETRISGTVDEEKFNAVVTVVVYGVDDKEKARSFARRYYRDEYGHDPSKVTLEKRIPSISSKPDEWEAMIADHSSGSLKGKTEMEL